jgi:acetyl/propionyl-CoA carboxylase alpha subunit/acetyl-CoA carboxylase carboxyltransferase component
MKIKSLLIANRGEIAIRIARAARLLQLPTTAIYSADDSDNRHVQMADAAIQLTGQGAAAYLDIKQIVEHARRAGCDAIHPGYGFLSENADFAQACADAGLTFVGPDPALLRLFGDKAQARIAAKAADVPLLPGTDTATTLAQAQEFLAHLPAGQAMIIKALAGGGGRGVRIVRQADELEAAFQRCQSEARAAFGNDAVYVEALLPQALHIEVQIIGDGQGQICHLYERDCTLQRRHQKLIEIAPSPALTPGLRQRIIDAAVRFARSVNYRSLGTFEFLVDASVPISDDSRFAFIEANARLQVEHTVTEAVTQVDLVASQLQIAGGARLPDLGPDLGLVQTSLPPTRGFAIQCRVNMETMQADGSILPSGGQLHSFDPPSGPGVRVDTFGYTGYRTNPSFDSLLAKVITYVNSEDFGQALELAYQALSEFRISGVATNLHFLQSLLRHPATRDYAVYTRFIDEHLSELLQSTGEHRSRYPDHGAASAADTEIQRRAGANIDANDPLAVLNYGQAEARSRREQSLHSTDTTSPDGTLAIKAPMQGTVVEISVTTGDSIRPGQQLLIMESMKMEHEIRAEVGGIVRRIDVAAGDVLYAYTPLMHIEVAEVEGGLDATEAEVDLDEIRPDLAEIIARRALTLDENRPKAVARRHDKGQRTTRENIADLCDADSFIEYGPLVVAAQAARRSREELIEKSPADGMITGIGSVNGQSFAEPANRCAIMAYDYTVFAGTQGARNHRKSDRIIQIAEQGRLPLVLFAEGGGGRPGDTEGNGGGTNTFASFPRLSGLVPLVGITSGRCFAGNASLLGCCDVIIATADSNIGMGGPAMIEGGGLGVFAPEDIGPIDVQTRNGVIDVAVSDEAEAVQVAKQYLSYFQGRLNQWEAPDQRRMRRIVPENRLRSYNIRDIIETIADTDSVLELRRHFGEGMVTALIRIEGRPVGVLANNPMHLGGAIDTDGSDKGARFIQLCDAFDIPILYLCDTPGMMVGPEVEKTALVRHCSRLFLTGANVSVPFFTIVIRKAYGLGAIAMAGGSYFVPYFTVSWPTGEFAGMGIEGSVKLGYRDELAAITDPQQRKERFDQMVARAYERSRAIHGATHFSIDDTIDPAESRSWVSSLLKSIRMPALREGKKRPMIDAW